MQVGIVAAVSVDEKILTVHVNVSAMRAYIAVVDDGAFIGPDRIRVHYGPDIQLGRGNVFRVSFECCRVTDEQLINAVLIEVDQLDQKNARVAVKAVDIVECELSIF